MKFSVITPTYNRCETLGRLYESLKEQSLKSFEWIIVNDGSLDLTSEVIKEFKNNAPFEIVYLSQVHAGKHVAVNKGVQVAKGEFVIIADSDDIFSEDALKILYDSWLNIPVSNKKSFAGVTGLCQSAEGNVLGHKFPFDIYDSSPADIYYLDGIRGDKAGFLRTDVIKQHPFPEIKDFNFYVESIIWNRIGKKFKTRYINEVIRIVFDDAVNQITSNDAIVKSKNRLFYFIILNDDREYLFKAPWRLFKTAIQATRFSLHQKETLSIQKNRINHPEILILWFFSIFPAIVLWGLDLIKIVFRLKK